MRRLLTVLGLSLFFVSTLARAEWTPDGPLHLQIGFGAGGSTDTLGRLIASEIEEQMGWEVIVENKPGGGGVAMFSGISQAPADGQTIGIGVNIPILMNLVLRGDKLPFNADSFDYLATVTVAPLAIVAKADAPYNDFRELVAWSKENDGALLGFDAKPQEMTIRAINANNEGQFKLVSYKSGAESVQGVLGGHVAAGYSGGAHIQYVNSGDLKVLAVATADRHGYSPDTMTLREQGFDYAVEPYFFLAAPRGLPDDTRDALVAALDAAIASDRVAEMVVNTMHAEPRNLGAEGTRSKLVEGVADIRTLIDAAEG